MSHTVLAYALGAAIGVALYPPISWVEKQRWYTRRVNRCLTGLFWLAWLAMLAHALA